MSCGIYKITNTVSKHAYIGKSVNIEERLKSHFSATKLFNTESIEYKKALYVAMRKYGIDNFIAEILEETIEEALTEREKYWIAFYNTYYDGYNETPGGEGVQDQIGEKHPNHKLTEADVINIRYRWAACKETVQEIYEDYRDKVNYNSGFKKIYSWQTWKTILPELFTEENRQWHRENARVLFSHKGENNYRSKLTDSQVKEIRARHNAGEKNKDIYKDYEHTGIQYRSFINILYGFSHICAV